METEVHFHCKLWRGPQNSRFWKPNTQGQCKAGTRKYLMHCILVLHMCVIIITLRKTKLRNAPHNFERERDYKMCIKSPRSILAATVATEAMLCLPFRWQLSKLRKSEGNLFHPKYFTLGVYWKQLETDYVRRQITKQTLCACQKWVALCPPTPATPLPRNTRQIEF